MKEQIKGKSLAAFRYRIAQTNNDAEPEIPYKTLSYPLEYHQKVDLSAVHQLYKTFHGSESGSLAYLLFTLHLCGFRLFDNNEIAQEFRDHETPNALIEKTPIAFDLKQLKSNKDLQTILQSNEFLIHNVVTHLLKLTDKDNPLKEVFCSKSNALSWLFGVGLNYLRTVALLDFCRDYGISSDYTPQIKTLLNNAKLISKDRFFYNENYTCYRKIVFGFLASWLSSYHKRLKLLSNVLPEITPFFITKDYNDKDLFRNTHTDYEHLAEKIKSIQWSVKSASQALEIIKGKSDKLIEVEQLDIISAFSDIISSTHSTLKQINANIKRLRGAKNTELKPIKIPQWLKNIPSVPKFSGIMGSNHNEATLKKEIDFLNTQYEQSLRRMRQHREHLIKEYHSDPITVLKTKYDYLDETQKQNECIIRNIIDPFFRSIRGADPEICNVVSKWIIINDWLDYPNKTKCKYIIGIYLYDFSGFFIRRKNNANIKPIALKVDNIKINQIVPQFKKLLAGLYENNAQSAQKLADLLKIEFALSSILISGLNKPIMMRDAHPKIPPKLCTIPALLQLKLSLMKKDDYIETEIAKTLFNLHRSTLEGLMIKLKRREFMLRYNFRQINDCNFIYVASNKEWTPHIDYFDAKDFHGFSAILETIRLKPGQTINAQEVIIRLQAAYRHSWGKTTHLSRFLQIVPHHWAYKCGEVKQIGKTAPIAFYVKPKKLISVTPRKKKESENKPEPENNKPKSLPSMYSKVGKISNLLAFNIRNLSPDHYRNLDKLLLGPEHIQNGDVELCVQQDYRQRIKIDNNGGIKADIELQTIRLTLNIPFKPTELSKQQAITKSWMDRIMAVYLYDGGIAIAVYEIKNNRLIKTDIIKRSDICDYLDNEQNYRRRIQPMQAYHTTFNHRPQKIKETYVGKICATIDSLMYQYNAIPIFKRGSTRDKFFNSILEHYIYCDIEAQRDRKKDRWCTDKWQHPYLLKRLEWDAVKKQYSPVKDPTQPVWLFPGQTTNAYYIWQECSKCHRCASITLDVDYKKETTPVKIEKGEISLSNGIIITNLVATTLTKQKIKSLLNNLNSYHGALFKCVYSGCLHKEKSASNIAKNMIHRFMQTVIVSTIDNNN